MNENRSDRAENAREQRTDRAGSTQQQRTERQANDAAAAHGAPSRTAAPRRRRDGRPPRPSRAATAATAAQRDRSGTRSDAFSGYSSGKSERAASQRGQKSRSSSRERRGRGGDDETDRSARPCVGLALVACLTLGGVQPDAARTARSRRRRTRSRALVDGRQGRQRRRGRRDLRPRRTGADRHLGPGDRPAQPRRLRGRRRRALAARSPAPADARAGDRQRGLAVPGAAREGRRRLALRHGRRQGGSAGAPHRPQRAGGDRACAATYVAAQRLYARDGRTTGSRPASTPRSCAAIRGQAERPVLAGGRGEKRSPLGDLVARAGPGRAARSAGRRGRAVPRLLTSGSCRSRRRLRARGVAGAVRRHRRHDLHRQSGRRRCARRILGPTARARRGR